MNLAFVVTSSVVGRHLGRGVHCELDVLSKRDERVDRRPAYPLVDLILVEIGALDFDFGGQVLEDGIGFSEVLEAEEDARIELGSNTGLGILDVDAIDDGVDGDAGR